MYAIHTIFKGAALRRKTEDKEPHIQPRKSEKEHQDTVRERKREGRGGDEGRNIQLREPMKSKVDS
jgi:hypothetical protein